ncbi:MAG: tetratricopeptide repeat protein [Bacteroidia bacterium]|nr:tetratricopeptide repeat protein [Bacteroidia bacterium]MDW8417579.1 tetratricopeptide repeat protein [Bacteroidia bacterium]
MRPFIFFVAGFVSLLFAQITEVLNTGRLVQFAYQMYRLYAERNVDKKQKIDSSLKLIRERLQMLDPDGVAKAIEGIRQFVPRKEKELQLLQALGYALAGSPRVAEEMLRRLVIDEKNPSLSILKDITKGWIYLRQSDYELAKEVFYAILARAKVDTFPIVYWGLAEIALRKGALSEAEMYAQQAHSLAPKDAQSYALLGEVYLAQRRFQKGEIAYREALKQNPDFPPALLGIGKFYLYSAKRYADARSYFEKAIRVDSSLLEAHVGVALGYLIEGKIREAHDYIERRSSAFLSADLHALRGIILFNLGDCLNKVLFPNPSDSLCKHSMESLIEYLHLTKNDRPGYITLSDSLLEYGIWLSFVLGDAQNRQVFCESSPHMHSLCDSYFQTFSNSPILSVIKARELAIRKNWDSVLVLIKPHLEAAKLPLGGYTLYAIALWESQNEKKAMEQIIKHADREAYLCIENGYLFTEYIRRKGLIDTLTPEMEDCLNRPSLLGNYASRAKYAYNLSQIALHNNRDTTEALKWLERILTTEFSSGDDGSYKKAACKARKQLFDLHLSRGDIKQAERMLKDAYRTCPKDTDELELRQIYLLYAKGDTIQGDELLRRLSPSQLENNRFLVERLKTLSPSNQDSHKNPQESLSPMETPGESQPPPPTTAKWTYSSGYFQPVPHSSSPAPKMSRNDSSYSERISISSSATQGLQFRFPSKLSYSQWLDTLYDYLLREGDQFISVLDLFYEEHPDRKGLYYELQGLFHLQKMDTQNAIKYLSLAYKYSTPDEQELTRDWLEAIGLEIPPILKAKLRRGLILMAAYGYLGNNLVKANNLFQELLKEYKTELSGYILQLLAQQEESFLEEIESLAESHPIILGSMLTALFQETPEDAKRLINYLSDKVSSVALLRVLQGIRSR